MAFHLPQEYIDFVSDKDSLLREVQLNHVTDNYCLLQIFFATKLDLASTLKKRDDLSILLNRLIYYNGTVPYLWHESRELSLVVSGNEKEWYISAVLTYGDFIEDEWFLTYLAMKLSEMDHSLMIRVFDNDGEFLLIEAAEVLDDWINPDIATNRVWLIGGKIHFLPLTMSNHDELSLQSSLAYLREQMNENALSDILANIQIQRAIQSKTTDLYPQRCLALDHCITAIVPRWVACVLENNATIVGTAVSSLSSIESVNISKRVQPIHIADNDDLVVRSIRMSKAQYAQLTFKQFKMPRKYHTQMRRMAEAQSAKVTKAFDLGCRLLCGLELAVARDQDNRTELDEFRVTLADNLKHNLTEIESSEISETSFVVAVPLSDSIDLKDMIGLISCRQPSTSEIIASNIFSMSEGEPLNSENDIFSIVKQGSLPWDSDDWMYLSPEEFDKRMNSITEVATKSSANNLEENNKSSVENSISPSSAAKIDNLQSIVDGFKSFLLDSSDLDGVATPSQRISKTLNKKSPPTKPFCDQKEEKYYYGKNSFTGKGFDEKIDKDYLMQIIQNPSVSSAVSININVEEEAVEVAYAGIATKLCAPCTNIDEKENIVNSDDESGHDSDDISASDEDEDNDDEDEDEDFNFEQFQDQHSNLENDENIDDHDDEFYSMEDIQRAMDSELLSEDSFMNTFQSLLLKKGGDMNTFDPSNFNEDEMDEQFLSNFLNAHAEGMGGQLGPFQQILSQLGLELPRPPPVT